LIYGQKKKLVGEVFCQFIKGDLAIKEICFRIIVISGLVAL
jgi:hypothetical protein